MSEQASGVALVTGAAQGIGRGIALALARAGMDVAINDVVADPAQTTSGAYEVKGAVEAAGRRAVVVRADVADAADRQRIVEETLAAFGQIDLLVNNAGVAPKVRADVLEMTEASYDRVMGINLKGPLFLTQLVARQMIRQGGGMAVSGGPRVPGRIAFTGSISAYTSSPARAQYCISKAGVAMVVRVLADRLAEYNIPVFELRPGIIATPMTAVVKDKYDKRIAEGLLPTRRWGRPEDVGAVVAALAGGAFDYCTGQAFEINGGFHIQRL
jgi:NAD(P)-dependent dehydrogenase (short-subunit alcohol dehydrogenase family)